MAKKVLPKAKPEKKQVESVQEFDKKAQEESREEKERSQGLLKKEEKKESGPSLERIKEVAERTKDPMYATRNKISESRKLLDIPVPAGQRLFETPDGEILLGDEKQSQMWCRNMNNGQGGWANPRR